MRKYISFILILCLLLTGCSAGESSIQLPADWTAIAPFLAAEPVEGYAFGESADTLGLGGVYYATWTRGEAREYTNAQGEETVIFDSQIYLVAQESRTESDAQTALAQWMAREKQSYTCGEETPLTVNGREYILLPLLSGSETNPYGFGYAAFTTHGTNAICVELVCSETFTDDAYAAMEQFLSCLHYSE